MPRWAALSAALLILAGLALAATRPGREQRAAVTMLNDASVQVTEQSDGFHDAFGLVRLNSQTREYEALLGECERRPQLAWEVFREVLEHGTTNGRILCTAMAFYLAQQDRLSQEDLALIAGQLSAEKPELQRAAQRALSNLLVLRDQSKAADYEKLPAAAEAKEQLSAKTKPITQREAPPGSTWLTIRWSSPAACRAWWQAFGAKAAWDKALRRFVISEGP